VSGEVLMEGARWKALNTLMRTRAVPHQTSQGAVLWRDLVVLGAGTLLLVALTVQLWRSSGPLWSANPDPGYQYLLNGGNLVSRDPPGHFDHPGTSLQWLSGAISIIVTKLQAESSIRESLAIHPEVHATALVSVLIALFGVAVLALLATIRWFLGFSPALATLFVTAAGTLLTIPWLFLVQPEAIVVICATLVVALLVVYQFRGRQANVLIALALGTLLATGLTAKIIMLPMLVVTLILLRTRDRLVVLASFVVVGLLILKPLWAKWLEVVTWFISTAGNPGRTGETGRSWQVGSNLVAGVAQIGIYVVVLLVVVALTVAVFANRDRMLLSRSSFRWPIAMGTGIIITLLIAYKPTTIRDFTVLVPLTGGLVAWGIANVSRSVQRGFLILLGLLTIVSLTQVYRTNMDRADTTTTQSQEVARLLDGAGGRVALSFGAWSEGSALRFGNEWSFSRYSSTVMRRYPNELEYSLWHRKFYDVTDSGRVVLTCDELAKTVRSDGVTLLIARDFAHNPELLEIDGNEIVLEDSSRLLYTSKASTKTFVTMELQDVECPAKQ
jgi:hypothetical protein